MQPIHLKRCNKLTILKETRGNYAKHEWLFMFGSKHFEACFPSYLGHLSKANLHILSGGIGNQDVGSRQHWIVGSSCVFLRSTYRCGCLSATMLAWKMPGMELPTEFEKESDRIQYLQYPEVSYALKGTLQRYQYNCHVQLVFWNLLVSIKVLFDPIGWGGPAPRQRRAAEASGPVT